MGRYWQTITLEGFLVAGAPLATRSPDYNGSTITGSLTSLSNVAGLFAATTKGLNTLVQAGEKLVFVTLGVWRSLRNRVQLGLSSSTTGHRDISQDQQEHPCSEKKGLNMQ